MFPYSNYLVVEVKFAKLFLKSLMGIMKSVTMKIFMGSKGMEMPF